MNSTFKLIVKSSRPISWVNTAYPFALAYILLGGSLSWVFWVGTLFFLIPYNYLMYGLNDVFDYESDLRNPRKGGVEGAVVPKKFHKLIVLSSIGLSVPFVVALAFGTPSAARLTLAGVLFFVVAYSAQGLRFKEIPLLDSLTSSIHFVGPALYALAIFQFPAYAWPFIVAFLLWGIASHAFGAIQDIIPDKEAHIRSIATQIGARATNYFALLCYAAATILIASQGAQYSPIALCGLLYCINVAQFSRVTNATSGRTNRGWRTFLINNYVTGTVTTVTIVLLHVL